MDAQVERIAVKLDVFLQRHSENVASSWKLIDHATPAMRTYWEAWLDAQTPRQLPSPPPVPPSWPFKDPLAGAVRSLIDQGPCDAA